MIKATARPASLLTRFRTDIAENPAAGFARSLRAQVRAAANQAVRIARIDLDRDPWWLYFRRRR